MLLAQTQSCRATTTSTITRLLSTSIRIHLLIPRADALAIPGVLLKFNFSDDRSLWQLLRPNDHSVSLRSHISAASPGWSSRRSAFRLAIKKNDENSDGQFQKHMFRETAYVVQLWRFLRERTRLKVPTKILLKRLHSRSRRFWRSCRFCFKLQAIETALWAGLGISWIISALS